MDENLTKLAYLHLRQKIRAGTMSPGSKLVNRALAKEIGVGISPVRAALYQLIKEGYLDHQPGLGVFIPVENRRELEEIYEFREVLEITAIEKCCGKMREKSLSEMARYIDVQASILDVFLSKGEEGVCEDDFHQWSKADADFHSVPLYCLRNRKMSKILEAMWTRIQTVYFRLIDWPHGILQQRTIDEHRQILEALRTGDKETAKAVLTKNIQIGLNGILEAYDRKGGEVRETQPFWTESRGA